MKCNFPAIAALALLLLGCQDSSDTAFLAGCKTKLDLSESACRCINKEAKSALDGKGLAYVRAVLLKNNSEAQRIFGQFGLFESAKVTAKAGVLMGRLPQQCDVGG